jgi:hypothetical protein
MLVYRKIRRALAVDPHDIGLHLMRVGHRSDLPKKNRRPVNNLHRQIVEFADLVYAAVEFDPILPVANLDRTGGDYHIGRIQRLPDILRRKPVRIHLRRVQIDHYRAVAPAERRRRRDAFDDKQAQADEVQAVVKKLLLRQRLARNIELYDRNVGGVVVNDVRRLHAGREDRKQRLRRRTHLRDPACQRGARMKIDLDYARAGYRLRLDVLDVVDDARRHALGDDRDAALHIDRRKPRVRPYLDDDREVDRRKNIGVHAGVGEHSQHQHQQRHHCYRERPAERETNNPHGRAFSENL